MDKSEGVRVTVCKEYPFCDGSCDFCKKSRAKTQKKMRAFGERLAEKKERFIIEYLEGSEPSEDGLARAREILDLHDQHGGGLIPEEDRGLAIDMISRRSAMIERPRERRRSPQKIVNFSDKIDQEIAEEEAERTESALRDHELKPQDKTSRDLRFREFAKRFKRP